MDYEIPPDIVWGPTVDAMSPVLWHWPPELAAAVGKIATGKGIKIAVGDTGYTKHRLGPDPIAARSFIAGQSVLDGNGHGTHCIGTALGKEVGVAPDAELIVFKCLSNQGSGSSSAIAAGIRWAAEQGADVISLSLGGGGSDRETNEAIDFAWSLGCVVNAAAGNAGYNGANTIGWPARYTNCLCCGAYREDGRIANFSSGGPQMDWACPGENIISFATNGSGLRVMSGTSMATPGGSGIIALMLEIMYRQGATRMKAADNVREIFKKNLKDGGAPGYDPRFGWGFPVATHLLTALIRQELVWS